MTPQGAAEAACQAFNAAQTASAFKIADFDKNVRPDTELKYETLRGKKTRPSKTEIFDYLFEICNILKVSDEVIDTHAYVNLGEEVIELLSSGGAKILQDFYTIGSSFGAAARRGDIIPSIRPSKRKSESEAMLPVTIVPAANTLCTPPLLIGISSFFVRTIIFKFGLSQI